VAVNESDPRIIKNYSSAFTKTKLDALLKQKGCNALFLCGLSAVGCVLATYYGAMDRGYDAFMVSEGLISHNAKYTDVIRDICNTVHFEKMKSMIEKK
jgi:nicotinamidase-related amidase